MEIFTREGGEILSRWGHYLSGVTWIGLLYYFNFVQVPAFASFEAGPRTEAITKLVPRALWWFRWAAVATVATGLLIISTKPDQSAYWDSSTGVAISTGILIALIMFANVWGIIWRNQKIVIASAERVAAGGEADPAAAAAGRKALVASRTNTLFSIPMLFFMGAASHFAGVFSTADNRGAYYGVMTLIVVLVELNAVGVFGGVGPSPLRKYADSHRDTIIAGFVLWVVLYLLWEIFF
ncbi:MAG: hypothetical protein QOG87_4234 [Actinomycetota bacterium]|jgi:uncharacterized membrane protein